MIDDDKRPELRRCPKCNEVKRLDKDFYYCIIQYRNVCKKCTSKANSEHQKKTRLDPKYKEMWERKRLYQKEYYRFGKNDL